MKKFFSNHLALLIALLTTLFFFLPHLAAGKIPFPADAITGLYHPFRDAPLDGYQQLTFPVKNPLITDPIFQTYPWKHLTVDNFKHGQLPLWNPYSFSGQPLLANVQSAPFQFVNIFFLVLPFNVALAISLILPSLLTTLFMYLFLRDLKVSRTASAFGSICLPLSGFFIAWLSWGSIVATVMWLPLILLCINKILRNVSASWFLTMTFATSQVILSGHWQAGFYVFSASLLYIILRIKIDQRRLFFVALPILIGVLISAGQILPAAEMLKFSSRDIDQGYFAGRQDWFIPYKHLAQLVSPDYFGNPTTNNYWGVFNYGEFVSFVGIVPLAFAVLAIIKKVPGIKFFMVLAAIALLFGLENPVSKIPYLANFPIISSSQPSRIIFLLDFAIITLAAFGIDSFLKSKSKYINFSPLLLVFILLAVLFTITFAGVFQGNAIYDTQRIAVRNLIIPTATLIAVAAVLCLKFFKVSPKIIIGLIFAVTILELFHFGSKFISFSKTSWIFPSVKTTEFLMSQPGPYRILTTDRRIMHPNISAVYGIESVDGYDPLYLLAYNQLVSSWQSNNPDAKPSAYNRIVTPQKYDSPITNLLNVKYVLTFDDLKSPNFVKVFEEGQTKVYENLEVLPRAYFVNEILKVDSTSEELRYLLDANSDLPERAVSQEISFPRIEGTASASITNYQDQHFKVETKSNDQMPLVISNVYYPGWKAYIDGQKTNVYKINFILQSVIVPAGNHTIEFKFQPQSFYNGLYLSAAGILAAIVAAAIIWKRKSL